MVTAGVYLLRNQHTKHAEALARRTTGELRLAINFDTGEIRKEKL
jgi:hypothetical protein